MSDDGCSFFSERKDLLSSLFSRFQMKWNEIFHMHGQAASVDAASACHAEDVLLKGRVHEKFMDVCLILLCVGDVSGYITADAQGFVKASRCDPSFLEGFIVCMEVTHVLCLKYLASKDTVKKPGFDDGPPQVYKVALVQSEHQKVFSTLGTTSEIISPTLEVPRFDNSPSLELVQLFLEESECAFGIASAALAARDAGEIGPCGPSMIGLNTYGVRFLRERGTGTGTKQSDVLIILCLMKSSEFAGGQNERLTELGGFKELDCELECVPPTQSVFDENMVNER